MRAKPLKDSIAHCAPKRGGGFLVVTRKGVSFSSDVPIAEGSQVVTRNGEIERVGR